MRLFKSLGLEPQSGQRWRTRPPGQKGNEDEQVSWWTKALSYPFELKEAGIKTINLYSYIEYLILDFQNYP